LSESGPSSTQAAQQRAQWTADILAETIHGFARRSTTKKATSNTKEQKFEPKDISNSRSPPHKRAKSDPEQITGDYHKSSSRNYSRRTVEGSKLSEVVAAIEGDVGDDFKPKGEVRWDKEGVMWFRDASFKDWSMLPNDRIS